MFQFIVIAEFIAWIVFTFGFCLSGTEFSIAKRLKSTCGSWRCVNRGERVTGAETVKNKEYME